MSGDVNVKKTFVIDLLNKMPSKKKYNYFYKNDNALSVSEKLLPLEHKLYFKTLQMIENRIIYLRDNKIMHFDRFLNEPIVFD